MKKYKRYEHGSYPFPGQDWDQRRSSGEEGLGYRFNDYTQGNRSGGQSDERNRGPEYFGSRHRDTPRERYFGNLSNYEDRGTVTGPGAGRNAAASHSGKGPRSYQRPDERIKEIVCDKLSDDPYVDASGIEVDVQHAEVTLTGTVDSRDTKLRVEDIVEGVSGISNVVNKIKIEPYRDQYDENPYLQDRRPADLRSKTRETFR